MGFMDSISGLVGSVGSAMSGGASSFLGGAGSALVGGLFGSGSQQTPAATDGVNSALQGANVPPPDSGEQPAESTGAQAGKLVAQTAMDIMKGVASQGMTNATNKIVDSVFGNPSLALAQQQGKNARAFMSSAYPEANAWDLLGAGGGTDFASAQNTSDNAMAMQDKQFEQQKELQEMQLNTQKQIAGIQAATSRMNTRDQVYAQNMQLTDRIQNIRADTANKQQQMNEINSRIDLNRQQKINLMSSKGLIDSQTQGQLETNQNIPLDGLLKFQQGQNARYQASSPTDLYHYSTLAVDDDSHSHFLNSYQDTLSFLHSHLQHQSDIHKNASGVNGPISGKPKDKR